MNRFVMTIIIGLMLASSLCAQEDQCDYLHSPPVFISNEIDIPLTMMSSVMPPAGKTAKAIQVTALRSDGFRSDGESVQPNLGVDISQLSVGALHGYKNDWAAGIEIPLASFGLELPTGENSSTFDASNPATNAYYNDFPKRLPLGWQPSSGTWNGFLGLAYGRQKGRVSYDVIAATKLYSADDEDVKIGNVFVFGINATMGVTPKLAAALGVLVRSQADDSYPQAPSPGVNSPTTAGTTTHGTTVMINPSIRYKIGGKLVMGVAYQMPVVKPDDGMIPESTFSLIFYPSL